MGMHGLTLKDLSRGLSNELPDMYLINSLGAEKTAELFGLKKYDTPAFFRACQEYNQAWRQVVRARAIVEGVQP